MGKKKNIVEKFIKLLNNKTKLIERDFEQAIDLSNSLDLINRFYSEEELEDFSRLKGITADDFQRLVSMLVKDDEEELKKSISASHFLVTNDIDLVEDQKEKLRDFNYRAGIKRRNLSKSIKTRENNVELIELFNSLENELKEVSSDGYLTNDMISKIFDVLKIDEEEREEYLKESLMFNYLRYSLSKEKNKVDEVELLEIFEDEDVIDIDESKFSKDDLGNVFKKHGYDLSILNEECLNMLTSEGNLEKIDSIFESIKRNRLSFLNNDKKNARILTKFLLDSDSKIIDEVVAEFKKNHIDLNMLKNYKVVFFPSKEELKEEEVLVIKKRQGGNSGVNKIKEYDSMSPISITGKHKDFFENLKYFENLGYDRDKLLEREVKLLTTSHKILLHRMAELKLYDFSLGNKDFPLSSLHCSRIMELSDKFIEVGEEQYILKYASKLATYQDGIFERLYALKKEGLPYKTDLGKTRSDQLSKFVTDLDKNCGLTESQIDDIVPKDADNILKGNKFNNLLDDYLPFSIKEETLESPLVRDLDTRYKTSNWSYNFNGVIVSRKKFLRNYEFLMNTDLIPEEEKDIDQIMLVSAIYKSKLTMEEIEKVHNGLSVSMIIGGKDEVLKK